MNITTIIENIGYGLDAERKLGLLNFTVKASAEGVAPVLLDVSKIGGDFPPPAIGQVELSIPPSVEGEPATTMQVWGEYTPEEIAAIADAVAQERGAYTEACSRLEQANLPPLVYTPPPEHVPTDTERKQLLADTIDNRVKFIYNRFMAFRMEYELREAAALAFKSSGYAGQPDALVKRFADNSGMGYQAATDLILAQSANLRNAIPALGNLRMDKYLVTRAATLAAAQAAFDATMTAIDAIDRGLA